MANVLLRVSARVTALVATAFALALLYFQLPLSGARSAPSLCDRCNVVLISFDTVRSDHMGVYGYQRPTTPNVDALARKSVVFDRAIAQAPWTLPSHGSMLSGLYPSRLGVLRYPATRVLPDQNTTLPEVFRAAGYATAGFTGGGFVSEHYGFGRGFDLYESNGRRYEHNMDATIEWVDAHKEKPFFLFFHGYDAHRPYYSKPIDKEAMGLPKDAQSEQSHFCLRDDRDVPDAERHDRIVRYYDASVHHGDRGIGALLASLEKMQLMENTIILLTSDHGEEFFEHGNCDHVRFLYNEAVQVPYIFYVPGYTPDGIHLPGLIPASISVARTLLDAVGIDHAMPGVTLLPMLEGKQKGFPVVYSEADSAAGILGSRGRTIALTKPDVKIISYLDEGTDEAYDLKVDPGEHHVLQERHAAYLLRQSLRSWSDSMKALPRPAVMPDATTRALLDDDEEDSTGTGGGSGASSSDASRNGAASPAGAGSGDDGAGGAKGSAAGGKSAGGAKGSAAGGDGGKAGKGGKTRAKPDKIPKQLKEDLKSLGYLQ